MMQPNRRLSDFLPLKFANGNQVKQFSKPCVRCGTMLDAKQMNGIARLVENHIAIAATAQCPKCSENFGVACVINPDKQVKRVVLPRVLFNLYLRALPVQKGEVSAQATFNRGGITPLPEVRDAMEDAAEIARQQARSAQVKARDIVRSEEALGRFNEKAIPAWLLLDGQRFDFERIAPNAQVGEGEFLLDGCLIYRAKA
ncbi:hypothetical protein [Deefgea piscis]|uniref:hypothetical protein n=1 Tax=Deefgea piscis TaxID=2739061 RepID=UPI001C7EC5EC|nr:hypothetical protein [Deefgea piscis]QZA81071.1 hypothetical protein K4H25_16620 [Deefgea piscis]